MAKPHVTHCAALEQMVMVQGNIIDLLEAQKGRTQTLVNLKAIEILRMIGNKKDFAINKTTILGIVGKVSRDWVDILEWAATEKTVIDDNLTPHAYQTVKDLSNQLFVMLYGKTSGEAQETTLSSNKKSGLEVW